LLPPRVENFLAIFTGRGVKRRLCYGYHSLIKPFTITTIIHTDQRYIQALLENDTLTVREIYSRYAGKVRQYILANSGSEDDAADIFQESLIDIYNQAKNKGLQLTCPFEPFLIIVCKRKWLNELKKRGRQPVTKDIDDVSIGEDVFATAEQLKQSQEKMQLFLQCFERLGATCKEIIKKCMGGEDQEKIAEQLKVTYGYLRKKKSECMASLVQMIRQDQDL
jgi:RNA polymerase sigma factor (sigma-70 family)